MTRLWLVLLAMVLLLSLVEAMHDNDQSLEASVSSRIIAVRLAPAAQANSRRVQSIVSSVISAVMAASFFMLKAHILGHRKERPARHLSPAVNPSWYMSAYL
ncbi:MAG: hypothetical protein ACM3ZC_09570 [Bacteroidota bacterium]